MNESEQIDPIKIIKHEANINYQHKRHWKAAANNFGKLTKNQQIETREGLTRYFKAPISAD